MLLQVWILVCSAFCVVTLSVGLTWSAAAIRLSIVVKVARQSTADAIRQMVAHR